MSKTKPQDHARQIEYLVTCERRRLRRFAQDKEGEMQVVFEDEVVAGYRLYIVQQWVTERSHFFKSVVTFTGNKAQTMVVDVIKFTAGGFEKYIGDTRSDNMRPMNFEKGDILVTNLTRLPPNLNLIEVPEGDFDKAITSVVLSINLRRLGCSGRTTVSLKYPAEAKDKFLSLYRISPNVPLEFAVNEIVRLMQRALMCFDLLPIDVNDGLLCDRTFSALKQYIAQFSLQAPEESEEGTQYNRVLAHLFSSVQAARHMLHVLGHITPKDPYQDVTAFRKSIIAFEESHNVEPTGFITGILLSKLFFMAFRENTALIKTKNPKIDEQTAKPTVDLEQYIAITSIDRLRYLWTGTGKTFVETDEPGHVEVGKEGNVHIGKHIKRATNLVIKPIDGAISTTVDGIKQGVKGVKNSLKPRDKKLVLLGEDGPGAIESFSNQPVDQTPSVESELRERKAVDHDGRDELRTAARLTADLEILLTQEDVFSGRMAELQKLEASYDQQIAQIKDICEKREKVVQEEEEMVKVAQKRIDKLLDELERMDTAKSMLQYQVSVCEDKLTEAQELIDNYSTIMASLESSVYSSYAFRFLQIFFRNGAALSRFVALWVRDFGHRMVAQASAANVDREPSLPGEFSTAST